MIITGIRGTELEKLFKKFYEQMISEQKEMFQMIKDFTGVDPVSVGVSRAKHGCMCLWDYDQIMFPKGSNPKNMTPYKCHNDNIYIPNRALQSANKFMREWSRRFKGLDGREFTPYGIPICSDFYIFNWEPICHKDKYGIQISNEMKKYLSNIKDKQYEIEVV